jgi:hypothetical protein
VTGAAVGTERLVLRPLRADLPAFVAYRRDPDAYAVLGREWPRRSRASPPG